MRHSLYANNRKGFHSTANLICNRGRSYGFPNTSGNISRKKDKVDMLLEAKINAVLRKYDDDPDTYAEVRDRVYMYCVNSTIARECNDKEATRRLRKELTAYLNTKL